jgi:hypothetical protein
VHRPCCRILTSLAGARETAAHDRTRVRAGTGARKGAIMAPGPLPVTSAWPITGSGTSVMCPRRNTARRYSDVRGGIARNLERGWSAGLRWATDFVVPLPASPLEVT